MLIVAPAALIPFGFILDAMARSTDNDDYANAGYYSLTGGLIGGLAAGIAGAMDYMAIESETEVKRTANVHAMLNGGAARNTSMAAPAPRWRWAPSLRWAYVPDLKMLPEDERVEHAMHGLERHMPSAGPTMQ